MIDSKGLALAGFSFMAFVVLIPPFFFHIRQKNIPAWSLIFWFLYSNLVAFINALIWSGENFNEGFEGHGYCDLVVRILSGSTVGELCATACMIFNLYLIVAAKSHGIFAPASRSRTIINIFMCWFNPLLLMGISVIVQQNRYNVVRYRGCTIFYKYHVGAVMLVSIWNILWIFTAIVFAVLTIFTIFWKRNDILDLLRCTNSGLNMRKFARLIIFGVLIITVLSPVVLLSFATDLQSVSSTDDVVKAYVSQIPWSQVVALQSDDLNYTTRIIEIVLSFTIFLLFGLGSEALLMYRSFLSRVGLWRQKDVQPQELYVEKEFDETRYSSKHTENSETTLGMDFTEIKEFERLVFDDLSPTSTV